MNDQDPIDEFQLQLDVAKNLATEGDYLTAYCTLVVAYQNLLEQYDELIDEVIELRKKLRLS